MSTNTESILSISELVHAPSFAQYLLNNKLDEYCRHQIQEGFKLNIPLLKLLKGVPDDVLYDITKTSVIEFLSHLSNNDINSYITISLERWKSNQLPFIDRDSVVAEDVTLVCYLRKKVLTHYIPDYTTDPYEIIELIKELDLVLTEMETSSSNTHIKLLTDRIEEHSIELQKRDNLYKQAEALAHLGNYVWYFQSDKYQWSDELYKIYEINNDQQLTSELIQSFVHPDDSGIALGETNKAIEENRNFNFHYRITTTSGKEKILQARGEVTHDEDGSLRIIGTVQDVTEKQTLLLHLERSESLYKQAEEIASMGTWSWDLKNNKLEWTDQLFKIYGLEPQSEEIDISKFLSFVHPEDRDFVKIGISDLEKKQQVDYTFRITTKQGELKWLRSIAEVHKSKKGDSELVIGTERDVTEKEVLINQLKESEKLYKQAQSLANIGNWTIDLKTHEFQWSDQLYKIYEIEKGNEFSASEWISYIHPDDKEDVLNYLDECIKEKKTYDKTHRIVLRGNKIKVLHRKGEFEFDENGEAIKMVGTTQDVTKQYAIQQELNENQKFIRKIADTTPSIIASYNINTGKYTFISEGLEKLLGYDPKEAMEIGVSFFSNIIHPDDMTLVFEKNKKVLEAANDDTSKNDLIAEFTYRMKHRQGHYIWFHTYGTIFDRNSEGKVEHVLNISLDVTEQVEASQKIKEQEHFIQQIADASPTILYLYDVQKQSIVYINREIFFVLGYSPDEIIAEGENLTETLYHPDDIHLLPARRQSEKEFQRVNSMIQYECRLKHKEGEYRWLLIREIVFKADDEGNITQILGAALDINKRKEMERTILQNTIQLEQSNASLEEFAYVASHDLKEPLRKISTFGDRLVASQSTNMTPEGKIYLEKIIDASQRMQTMISDLLSISMITGNHSFESYSLQSLLEEAIQTLEFKIEQQNAIIRYDQLPKAKVIPSQIRQLFQNLLSNSLKFVRDGVQPFINIIISDTDEHDAVNFGLSSDKKYFKIRLIDNGIGFENEFAGKIFAIFQRLHGRSEFEGSGIGLSICKKIVEHHGGIIHASGVPDEGAEFTIILPE